MGEAVISFIRIDYSSVNDSNFRFVYRSIEVAPKRPTREQARALLEQPVTTENLTIYRDEEENERTENF